MEKMIPVLEEIFGEDGYDEAEKAIIEHLGLKIVVDGDKVSIEVPSLGEQFKEQLKKGLRYGISESATNDWGNFIGGLTQDQYKQLFDWAGNGWIRGGGASTQVGKDTLMRMLNGGNYYNGTDLDMLSTAAT
nr:MAG TPA: Dynamin family [Caudoviricetes sp.]